MAARLAELKSKALSQHFPAHWIIGSDQVATLPDGQILGKPGNMQRAQQQLQACSGNTVTFNTGISLYDSETQRQQLRNEIFRVKFRRLSAAQIRFYLETEQPFDAAGSFYMEGLGIALFESLEGRDPNSLIGLPLIALIDMLQLWGVSPLGSAHH